MKINKRRFFLVGGLLLLLALAVYRTAFYVALPGVDPVKMASVQQK